VVIFVTGEHYRLVVSFSFEIVANRILICKLKRIRKLINVIFNIINKYSREGAGLNAGCNMAYPDGFGLNQKTMPN
jgi:hypothetical protein